MILGMCVKSNQTNKFTKPFIINYIPDNLFIAQIIRDVDFSFYAKYNEELEINILSYPDRTSYGYANINNSEPEKFNVIGKYNIIFDEIHNKINFCDTIKGMLIKSLHPNLGINITFNVILDKSQNDDTYILSTPCFSGPKKYLELRT